MFLPIRADSWHIAGLFLSAPGDPLVLHHQLVHHRAAADWIPGDHHDAGEKAMPSKRPASIFVARPFGESGAGMSAAAPPSSPPGAPTRWSNGHIVVKSGWMLRESAGGAALVRCSRTISTSTPATLRTRCRSHLGSSLLVSAPLTLTLFLCCYFPPLPLFPFLTSPVPSSSAPLCCSPPLPQCSRLLLIPSVPRARRTMTTRAGR